MIQITNTQSSHKQTNKKKTKNTKFQRNCARLHYHSANNNNNKKHITFIYAENGTSGEMLLEKILEEDSNYCDDRQHREFISHEHDEQDKKHLLGNGHTVTVHVTRI